MASASSVATISGNIITIVGAGTVNVTATQAETANFLAGTISTTFTVNKMTTILGDLIIPNKTFGDSSFNIVDPSSNRAGSFTYTSSNHSVATISGNTITIVGGGNTLITATQVSNASYNSASKTTTFRVLQASPIITNVEPGTNDALVHFDPNNLTSLPILYYAYSLNNDNQPVITNFTQSPILIDGLLVNKIYAVSILSYTSEGRPINYSNKFLFKTGTPNAPTITSITPSIVDSTFTVNYTQSTKTNNSAITKMFYSLNGRTSLEFPSITNPLIIPNITRGSAVNVTISSANGYGRSPFSNSVSSLIPRAPSRLTITNAELFLESGTTCYAIVNVNTPIHGDSPITTYKYALDSSNNFQDLSNNSLPIVIPNLPVNQSFNIRLIATNLLGGDSIPSSRSRVLRFTLLPPSAPGISSITTSLNNMLVNLTKPAINGSEIITYKYSLNNESFIDVSSNALSFSVPIENNTQYNLRVKAVNLVGESVPTAPLVRPVRFTYLPPFAPRITSITGSNHSLTVNFVGSTTRGASVTSYSYSLDSGSTIIDASTNTSPLIISGLTNNISYSVVIYANSLAGTSAASNTLSGTPEFAAPGIPVITSIIPLNNSCSVVLAPPVINGSPITSYFYSLDNGNTFLNANSSTSPLLITGLVNETIYNIRIRSVNAAGISPLSVAMPVIPMYTVPSAPIIRRITTEIRGTARRIKIVFTASLPRGSPIKAYYYSINDGVTLVNANKLTSPIIVDNLTPLTSYAVRLYSENDLGRSASSNSITIIPL